MFQLYLPKGLMLATSVMDSALDSTNITEVAHVPYVGPYKEWSIMLIFVSKKFANMISEVLCSHGESYL